MILIALIVGYALVSLTTAGFFYESARNEYEQTSALVKGALWPVTMVHQVGRFLKRKTER